MATYPSYGKISNEPIEPLNMIRATKLSSNPENRRKKNSSKRSFFTAQIPLFPFHPFIRERERGKKKNETRAKLDNRVTRNTVETRRSAERGLC